VSKVKSCRTSLGERITVSCLLGLQCSARMKSLRASLLAVCPSPSPEGAARSSPAGRELIRTVGAGSQGLSVA